MARIVALLLLAVAALGGCAQPAPLTVTTWGEEYIEDALPADLFADGWRVEYTKFLVVLSSVTVADAAGTIAGARTTPTVFDMKQPGPHAVVEFRELAAQRWDRVSIVIEPAAAPVAGTGDDADATFMGERGFSVYVEGNATKAAQSASFAFGFDTATEYRDCETEGEGAGIVVRSGEHNAMQVTVHGDHLFYDDLASDEAKVRFDAVFAADGATERPADGAIDVDELGAIDLTTLPSEQYGNAGANENLFEFMNELSRTLVHLNGEGECSIAAR